MFTKKIVTVFSVIATLVFVPVVMTSPATAAVSSEAFSMSPPSGLKSTSISKTAIGLSWQPVIGASKYRVQYSKSADMSNAGYIRYDTTSADIRNLETDTTYYFKVRLISADGATSLSDYSSALAAKTVAPPAIGPKNPLKVSTFNLKCSNCYDSDATADQLPWIGRRDAVVAQIKSEMPDVIGFQENAQAWLRDENGVLFNLAQFEDLQQRLVAAGANYKVTDSSRYNCVDDRSATNCVYKDQGASHGTKVYYNADTIEMIDKGSERLPFIAEEPIDHGRYATWGSFRQKSSGKSFFFMDTHLEPEPDGEYPALRIRQAERIVSLIKEKNTANLPVFIVGDLNSNKYTKPTNGPYDTFVNAGYVDPIGNDYDSTYPSSKATAESSINAEYNTYNGFNRALKWNDEAGHTSNGMHLDYILNSPMRVAEWKQVLNKEGDNLVGIIPADHNMIVSTVELPAVVVPAGIGPSLNAVDTGGKLWAYSAPGNTSLGARTEVASGWSNAKQVLSVDWNNDTKLDLVVRGADGYLTMHEGVGNGSYKAPVTIGNGGWQSYDITATKFRGSDIYPGLIARDSVSGNLYYYPNTTGGELTAPRSEIGTGGWQVMSEINALDWDKDGKMDLIARNPNGELMLYRSNGAGVLLYEASQYLDYGWNVMDSISAEPNFAGPGSVGLIARSTAGKLYYYPIANGKVNAPTLIGNGGWTGYVIAAGTPAL